MHQEALSRQIELEKPAENQRFPNITSHLPDEAFTGEHADQLAHFQSEQRTGELGYRELGRVRERVDLLRRVRRQQLENRSFML